MNGNDFGPRLKKLVDERARDNKTFAEELGVSLDYLQAMMVEPIAVSNPSPAGGANQPIAGRERRISPWGEAARRCDLYCESKENFNAWVRESADNVGALMAAQNFRPNGNHPVAPARSRAVRFRCGTKLGLCRGQIGTRCFSAPEAISQHPTVLNVSGSGGYGSDRKVRSLNRRWDAEDSRA